MKTGRRACKDSTENSEVLVPLVTFARQQLRVGALARRKTPGDLGHRNARFGFIPTETQKLFAQSHIAKIVTVPRVDFVEGVAQLRVGHRANLARVQLIQARFGEMLAHQTLRIARVRTNVISAIGVSDIFGIVVVIHLAHQRKPVNVAFFGFGEAFLGLRLRHAGHGFIPFKGQKLLAQIRVTEVETVPRVDFVNGVAPLGRRHFGDFGVA